MWLKSELLQIHNKNICCSCCVSETTSRRVSRHSTRSPSCRRKFKMWQRGKRFKTNCEVFFFFNKSKCAVTQNTWYPPTPSQHLHLLHCQQSGKISTHTKATRLLQAPWFRATPSLLYRVEKLWEDMEAYIQNKNIFRNICRIRKKK